ncbi:acetyl xylan esterase [Coprinopsis sp. MPI-PUGE-AT-0042]|nr:acetyl xylan esterase [Coprinopsis sp. MPI-PUGE-AT-0042]KAH6902263.1 acetyl xylan esterase [Coprinopsis sp. MPI-PUGE-AT-0042]
MKSFAFFAIFSSLASSVLAVPIWGQCGGIGYGGSTTCDSGLSCVKLNDWYSQCQQGTGNPPPVTTTTQPPPVTTIPPTTGVPPITTTTSAPPSSTVAPAPNIPAGQLTRLTENFGPNPQNVQIHVYKPSSIKPGAGMLVALHPCGGTAQQYFSSNQFRTLADQRGFLVLYGQAATSSNCWDVTGRNSLIHDAGGDSLGVASAVRYAINNWGINKEKVFVVGTSSGAMMTNVMTGVYPELFRGGAVFAGVALGCLSVGNAPANPPDPCAAGNRILSASEWGNKVRSAYSGYTGPYPKMQIWHGTADPILAPVNFQEQIKQWTDVFKVSQTPTSTQSGVPAQKWTKTVYGTAGQLEGYYGQGAGHGLPESGTESTAINWFGL